MRDRNQSTQNQFNIQLRRKVTSSDFYEKILKQEEYFSHKTCLWRSDPGNVFTNAEFKLTIPNSYRLVRSLIISHWYFPENIYFLYHIELENQNFSKFNTKQQIEIQILLSSKENCEKFLFLTERYTGNEIFGNILGNDLKFLSNLLKLRMVQPNRPVEKVYRRGPKDKGSRRSDSSARIISQSIREDFYLNELELIRIRKKNLTSSTINRILNYLENFI